MPGRVAAISPMHPPGHDASDAASRVTKPLAHVAAPDGSNAERLQSAISSDQAHGWRFTPTSALT